MSDTALELEHEYKACNDLSCFLGLFRGLTGQKMCVCSWLNFNRFIRLEANTRAGDNNADASLNMLTHVLILSCFQNICKYTSLRNTGVKMLRDDEDVKVQTQF